jgi:hypothetical protein
MAREKRKIPKGPKRIIPMPKQRAGGVMKKKRRGHGWSPSKRKQSP